MNFQDVEIKKFDEEIFEADEHIDKLKEEI